MTTLYDELTSGPLAEELAPFIAEGNDGAVLAVLNRKDIPGKKSITSHDIKAFFSVSGFYIPILDSTSLSCREAILNLNLFESFDMRNPAYLAKLTSILQGLVDETMIPDFQQEHMDYVLSLGDTLISRAEQLGINPTTQDIATALRG